ncbi:hypothetical protein MM326_09815 [Alkalihalobacillus sp. LMS6]|nr:MULTISPECIES: hypothetical protein [Bacillaceae]UTR08286.1 hypothetical protein MM326_09815 [Alkalihalobacillus sp. LMS6]
MEGIQQGLFLLVAIAFIVLMFALIRIIVRIVFALFKKLIQLFQQVRPNK